MATALFVEYVLCCSYVSPDQYRLKLPKYRLHKTAFAMSIMNQIKDGTLLVDVQSIPVTSYHQ